MSVETIARRYSTALADVVLEAGVADTAREELAAWAAMFGSSSDLRELFANPAINFTSKEKVLEEIIAKTRPSQIIANFLRVMLQNGRLDQVSAVNERFASVLEERSGVVTAQITSARELPEDERAEFLRNLEDLTKKKVRIDYSVDGSIIGGVVTRIGSTVYDGSVRTKLDNLRAELVNG